MCRAVDPLCNGHDEATGACTGCYQSFVLQNGQCIEDKDGELTDSNCASWMEGVCIRCATRTFMNDFGLCQNVNTNCNTYNPVNGRCSSCYPGFEVSNGDCVKSLSPSSCNEFNADGTCAKCGQGSYLSQGTCIAIDPQCAKFNEQTETCLACYDGYSLLNGACQVSDVEEEFEVENCYAYDASNFCIKCFDRYYLEGNSCKQVSFFCKTYDEYNGVCLTCYTNFSLINGECIK